jgi:hypothetical protein
MARKKMRALDSSHTLTWFFLGMLAIGVAAGFIAQITNALS